MNKLYIYGAEGFGREVFSYFDLLNFCGFLSDKRKPGYKVFNTLEHEVLGGVDFLENKKDCSVIIALGDNKTRETVYKEIIKINNLVEFPSLIHKSSVCSGINFVFNKGVIIAPNCSVSCNVKIGDFSIINMNCSIGHESSFGDFCTLAPGVNISGNCTIGKRSTFGSGIVVQPKAIIGNNVNIASGTIIVSNIESNTDIKAGINLNYPHIYQGNRIYRKTTKEKK